MNGGDESAATGGIASQVPRDLLDLAHLMLVTTPAYTRMREDPTLHNWSAEFVRFGERGELAPLAGALGRVAATISIQHSFTALVEEVGKVSAEVGLDTIAQACLAAEEAAAERPYPSFLLAWTALCLWIVGAPARGEDLYAEQGGWPHVGWGRIPATCIAIAIKSQGLHGSRLLAEKAHTLLQANWRRHQGDRDALLPALARYRRLLQDISSRYDMAVLDLTDDLRDAWTANAGRTRAFSAALAWSLGLVPECASLQGTGIPPSRRLLKRLIHLSLACLPGDPLIQYLWLELKGDPDFDLRAHRALFATINHRWEQWWLDEGHAELGLSAEPSRLFARTLVAYFAGDLDEAGSAEYLALYDWIVDSRLTVPPQGYVLHRLHMLRHLIGERFDYYGPDFTAKRRLDFLRERTEATGRGGEDLFRHPELPDMLARTSHASFEFIERSLEGDAAPGGDSERCTVAMETMERFRTGALGYWLRVNPPLPHPQVEPQLAPLLQEERRLLEGLRGAYFLALRPILPSHYWWSDMDAYDRMELEDPARREWFYSPDVAREEMRGIERALGDLADRLETHAPEYAARRRAPSANVERMVALLNLHKGGS